MSFDSVFFLKLYSNSIFLTNFNRNKEVTEMKSTNKILITTKKWHNHFSVLISNLTKNAPTEVI